MASLNIVRLPGEDEADFQRRYCREKMRIYRARKPKAPRKARSKLTRPRADAKITAEQWESLKQRPDEPHEEWRKRYARERMKFWRRNNPEKTRAMSRQWYQDHKEAEAARHARYRAENADKVKANQKAYFEANRLKRLAALTVWREQNAERFAEKRKRWYDNNQAQRNAWSARWRRAARQQTPPWADHDKIKAFYEEAIRVTAETGVDHHVDHIVPLQGKTVSGLHVHTNLRVIPAAENVRKRNRLLEELVVA